MVGGCLGGGNVVGMNVYGRRALRVSVTAWGAGEGGHLVESMWEHEGWGYRGVEVLSIFWK